MEKGEDFLRNSNAYDGPWQGGVKNANILKRYIQYKKHIHKKIYFDIWVSLFTSFSNSSSMLF